MAGRANSSSDENEYTRATKVVVDDAMRMDVLGPKVVEVIENYTPSSDAVDSLIEKSIKNNSAVRDEIHSIIDSRLTERKGQGFEKVSWQIILTVVGLVVAFILGKYILK